jgi:hypothetical protein
MVALQPNTDPTSAVDSSNLEATALIYDIKNYPGADKECIKKLLIEVEIANKKNTSPNDSERKSKTSSTTPTTYAAVLSPNAAATVMPVDNVKWTSTEEYKKKYPSLQGSERPLIHVERSTIEIRGGAININNNITPT